MVIFINIYNENRASTQPLAIFWLLFIMFVLIKSSTPLQLFEFEVSKWLFDHFVHTDQVVIYSTILSILCYFTCDVIVAVHRMTSTTLKSSHCIWLLICSWWWNFKRSFTSVSRHYAHKSFEIRDNARTHFFHLTKQKRLDYFYSLFKFGDGNLSCPSYACGRLAVAEKQGVEGLHQSRHTPSLCVAAEGAWLKNEERL